MLTDKDFIPNLKKFTPMDVTPSTLKLVKDYTKSKNFKPFRAADFSMALRYICQWVLEIESMAQSELHIGEKGLPKTKVL